MTERCEPRMQELKIWLFRVPSVFSASDIDALPPLHRRIVDEIDSVLLASSSDERSQLLNSACRTIVLSFLFASDAFFFFFF